VIDSLATGGAENLITDLVNHSDEQFCFHVYFFREADDLADDVESAGGRAVPLNERFPYDPRAIVSLKRHLAEFDPMVLHLHLPYARTIGRFLGQFSAVEGIVTTYHNSIDSERGSLGHRLDPFLGGIDDYSVGVSQNVTEQFRSRHPDRNWETVYNGIDIEQFTDSVAKAHTNRIRRKHGINSKTPVLLNVGRYVPQKSQRTIVEAAPKIIETFPAAEIILVGWGENESDLIELTSDLGVSDNVTITGKVPSVHEYYDLADVFVMASVFEGFGLTAVEAMAAKLPVIATDVTGLREVVADEETGYLIPKEAPTRLAEAVTRLMSSEDMNVLGEAGYQRAVKQFSIERTVAEYTDIYERFNTG
jgi:glycosyltransferase involved in cell wall biosynthesis